MSNLSSLLNPEPNPANAPASQTQPPATDEHTDGHPNETGGFSAQAQSESPHLPAIASPLEALAAAATSSAPMLSPSNPTGTSSMALGNQQHSFHHSLPRPTSSHTSPPPSFEFARSSDHSTPTFSPGLEQYHHSTSREAKVRRMSEATDDPSTVLAPLRDSLPDESRHSPVPLPGLRSSSEVVDGEVRGTSTQPTHMRTTSPQIEPGQPDNAPVLSQIRKPSLGASLPPEANALPGSQHEQVQVKAEITEDTPELSHTTQLDSLPPASLRDTTSAEHDNATEVPAVMKGAKDSKNSHSIAAGNINHSMSATPKSAPTKKRAAPKKGTASAVKPAAKKRKLDTDSVDGTPSVKRSVTPASSRASKTPAPKNRKQDSATPTRSSSVGQQDDDDDIDESELFCICRKPDDHTWMIGCDGSCEDWFHGRCVNMNEEDGKIIDKWICPNCQAKGEGPTTWKAMCRLEGCREPAKVNSAKPSKYCSDEHGREFMARHALKDDPEAQKLASASNNNKKRRKSNYTDNMGNGEDAMEVDEDPSYLHGGVLKASELKAVAAGIKDINEFRKLGEGVLSPPRTVSPDGNGVKMEDETKKGEVAYTPQETEKLAEITSSKESLRLRKSMLEDRDTFLGLVKARGKTVLDELRKKDKSLKDICGYDARLSLSDEEFKIWRCGPEGQKAFDEDVLVAPTPDDEATATGDDDELGRGVCQKKRCERHRNWYKIQQQEVAFEKDNIRQALRKLEEEERGVKNRAMIRCLEGGEAEGR